MGGGIYNTMVSWRAALCYLLPANKKDMGSLVTRKTEGSYTTRDSS